MVLTKYSDALGRTLWPTDEKGIPWTCLFFVDNLKEVNIPIKVVQELAEYSPTWDRVQGFMALNENGINSISKKFGSIENFMDQDPKFYQAIEGIIVSEKEEIIEMVAIPIDKDSLLAEAREYKDSGISHVIANAPQKRRVENRRQKQLVAQIEEFRCQVCGWSLEWTNSKNIKVHRIDIDHINEKSEGGNEELSNLWALCPNCHVKKTLGVIQIDIKSQKVTDNGTEITILDNHLFTN